MRLVQLPTQMAPKPTNTLGITRRDWFKDILRLKKIFLSVAQLQSFRSAVYQLQKLDPDYYGGLNEPTVRGWYVCIYTQLTEKALGALRRQSAFHKPAKSGVRVVLSGDCEGLEAAKAEILQLLQNLRSKGVV